MSVALAFSIPFPLRAHKEKRRQKISFYLAKAIHILPLSMEEELYKGSSTYLSSDQAKNATYSLMIDICLFSMTLILFLLTHLSSMKLCYSWRQWNFISIKADKNLSTTDRRGSFWKQKYALAVTEIREMNLCLSVCSYIPLKHYKTPWKPRC